jgi:hypothetical protein
MIQTSKPLGWQKSSSCLVPSKESAKQNKKLLTGTGNDKYNDTEIPILTKPNEGRSIKSFVIDDTKYREKKSFI